MTALLTLFSSTIISYFTHHFCENFLSRGGRKQISLIVKRRQIHHSFWGVIAIIIGLVFTSGHYELAILGYGIGNIWQHKITHNRAGEPGMVFISKIG